MCLSECIEMANISSVVHRCLFCMCRVRVPWYIFWLLCCWCQIFRFFIVLCRLYCCAATVTIGFALSIFNFGKMETLPVHILCLRDSCSTLVGGGDQFLLLFCFHLVCCLSPIFFSFAQFFIRHSFLVLIVPQNVHWLRCCFFVHFFVSGCLCAVYNVNGPTFNGDGDFFGKRSGAQKKQQQNNSQWQNIRTKYEQRRYTAALNAATKCSD